MASNDDDELVDVLHAASRRRRPAPEPVAPEPPVAASAATLPAPATEPVPVALITEPSPPEPPKEEKESSAPAAPSETLVAVDYITQLLTSNRNKKGKTIQLDPDNHRALTHIANTMGGITIADLLHNIVRLHFQEYGPKIQQMLKEKEALNKKEKLPFQRS